MCIYFKFQKKRSPQLDQKASTKSKDDQLQQKDSKKDLNKDSSSLVQKDSMRPSYDFFFCFIIISLMLIMLVFLKNTTA